jgi:hypothetical protein
MDDITCVEDIRELARRAGNHFFDRDTMSFFRSRILDGLWSGPGGVYFCTSERAPNSIRREYTVREAVVRRDVNPPGFGTNNGGTFTTARQAKARAKALAAGAGRLERL